MTVHVPSRARSLLDHSCRALLAAAAAPTVAGRYEAAYLASLVTAESYLYAVGLPARDWTSARLWDEIARIDPDMGQWRDRFESTRLPFGTFRTSGDVDAQAAHDLLRDAEAFHHVVEASLALPYRNVLPGTLPDVTEE